VPTVLANGLKTLTLGLGGKCSTTVLELAVWVQFIHWHESTLMSLFDAGILFHEIFSLSTSTSGVVGLELLSLGL
jgi:hypothetical protein